VTTIATDGKTLAADGLVTDQETIVSTNASKVRRLPSGDVVGVAGKLVDTITFARWLKDGERGKPDVWDKSEALLLRADGAVFWIDSDGHFAEAPRIAAIGSGAVFALAAMDAGAGPKEAVEIACRRDIHSGGTIIVMEPQRPCRDGTI
jgi:ATP-dependent protease HslVU (ClpYQ) peptidase subunit